MAKRKDEEARRREELPRLDEYYFDDDLDSVTGGLPKESDYLPPPEEEPQPEIITEGVGRAGIRMVGLPGTPLYPEEDEEYGSYGEDAGEEELGLERDAYADEDEPRQDRPRRSPKADATADVPQDSRKPKRKKIERVTVEEEEENSAKNKHPVLRVVIMSIITIVLLGVIGVMMLGRTMYPDMALLKLPERGVSAAVGPVQDFFSGVTEKVADYFRMVKLRSNIEAEYVRVVAENEELAVQAAQANELRRQISQLTGIYDEVQNNLDLNPLVCQVIGRDQGNYFSTFTINQGSRSGVEQYMAVTINGALVGYTETVYETTAIVRTIIDSNASIAGLIQSSRDQGTVRGTLGVDGTPMCRMYYLPDDHLPRPGDIVVTSGVGMSFPKGIPIGTVRESTRGMESNKQYIVVEPEVDFEHIEYVIVLRYKPAAEAVTGRESTASYNEFVPTVSARPYPTLRIGTTLTFGQTATPSPEPSLTPSPTPSPSPTPTPTPTPAPTQNGPVFEYNSTILGPTPTPSPTPTPTPTPMITIDPSQMTWEED